MQSFKQLMNWPKNIAKQAVTYYKAAIKTSGQNAFRYDLAHLLWRLKRYQESQTIITSALEISQTQSMVNLQLTK